MKQITVVGLGAGDLSQLPLGIYRHLKKEKMIYVRTKDHPVIKQLTEEGMTFHSFDYLYEQSDHFESVYGAIVDHLLHHDGIVCTYAVPGHPFVAEKTVQLLLDEAKKENVQLHFLGGHSFLESMYTSLQIDPIEGCQILDGPILTSEELMLRHHMIVTQVYDTMIASHVKLTLMEKLPDEYEITVCTAVGTNKEKLQKVPLYELDRIVKNDNLTAVYVPPVQKESLLYGEFTKLKETIAILRGPNGCPWDKKQTHDSLKKYLIEETYEVLEAIDEQDDDHLVEELGDILLQVMLHAQIGEDEGYFSIQDVIRSITEKMIRRHPHVFGEVTTKDRVEIAATWEQIKRAERGEEDEIETVFQSVPKGYPALMEAMELQKKAANVGFDWDDVDPIWEKLDEEINEFTTEVHVKNIVRMKEEFGDMLFVLVNLARFYNINAEEALRRSNYKFKKRFQFIESEIQKQRKDIHTMSLTQLDHLWEKAKEKGI